MPRDLGTRNHNTSEPIVTTTMGTPTNIHPVNDTLMPAVVRSRPTPIRFGGVPTGVPMPPIVAANDVTSIIAIAYRWKWVSPFSVLAGPHPRSLSLGGFAPRSGRGRLRSPPSSDNTASPSGNIIAVVAVLLIHIDKKHVTPAYATTNRRPLEPTHSDASAVNASRRSSR